MALSAVTLVALTGCARAHGSAPARDPAPAQGSARARACEALAETATRAKQPTIDTDQDGMIARNELGLYDPAYRAALAKASSEAEVAVRLGQAEQPFATAVREVELSETGQPYSSNIGQDLAVVRQVCAARPARLGGIGPSAASKTATTSVA